MCVCVRFCDSFYIRLCRAGFLASEWITASFTIERFIAVCYPMKAAHYCTRKRAKIISVTVLVCSLLARIDLVVRYRPVFVLDPINKHPVDVKLEFTEIGRHPIVSTNLF